MSTQPRILPPDPQQTPHFGTVMQHTPITTERFFELYAEFWQQGLIDPATKEMTRLRNARTTDCGY